MNQMKFKVPGKLFWDEEKIEMLGTMPDSEVARRLGVAHANVRYKRMALGIAACKNMKGYVWKQKDIRLLGKKSDEEVAALLGLTKTTIRNKRVELGIGAFAYQSKLWREWAEEELAMLGKFTDKEVGRRLNIKEMCVASKRHVLGIEPFQPRGVNKSPRPNAVKWTRQNVELLGKIPDKRIAEIMGVCRKSIMRKRKQLGIESYADATQFWHRWTEEQIAKIGTMTDRAMGEELGISVMCVVLKRRSLGIQAYTKTLEGGRNHVWKDEEIGMLGKKPDAKVAQEIGLSIGAVRNQRVRLGIPSYFESKSGRIVWTPELVERLGKKSAAELAEELGVSTQAIYEKRKQVGIRKNRKG
jgi:hypothetical protein